MKTHFLYDLIEDASLFNNETLVDLKKTIDRNPSFSLAKILYLKNLAVLNHPDFSVELKKLSVGIPDRRKLFLLIEDKLDYQSSVTMVVDEERENAFDLIDAFLSLQPNESSRDWHETLNNASVSSDYMYWSMSKQETDVNEENTVQLKHHQLIDSFIESAGERPRQFSEPAIPGNNTFQLQETSTDDILQSQDDSFFTETLAQIYIKQKRYERALQIIGKLRLKYPEKNVYFADQIRFLEKLIINNKNIK